MDLMTAESLLRPTATSLLEAWRRVVEAEKEQVESLPNRPRPEDFYAPVAESFRADPHRTGDPTLNALLDLARPDETWIDVGAGAGRYTLAIAMHVARAFAVEPSGGMRRELEAGIVEHGVTNLEVYDERWPGPSKAPVADVAFMSNVGHDIADIGPFLDQLERHARRLCVVALFEHAPIADFAPLWPAVHGGARVLLPGLRELIALLFARGSIPEVQLLRFAGRVYTSLEALQSSARRPIWVLPGSAADERLGQAIRQLAVTVPGGVRIGAAERAQGIVTWRPA